ncbi:MAG TPA: glycosyltransferase [Pseudolabrys sp.]|jgi:glycosyltransferase involved in cell wall biosynthesis|nr:glycosyltransferase [Pseudolabrys sp.]
MTFSVALATYNGQEFLEAQLESLGAQTMRPAELVVSDDGSSDGTLAIVSRFAKKASFPVRILRNTRRLGYRTNFMQAAAACSSELIAFCDQDDVWLPNKLALMHNSFYETDILLAYHNAVLIDAENRRRGHIFFRRGVQVFNSLSINPWRIIPGNVQVIRRSLLRLNPLHVESVDPYCPEEPMPHDHWFPFWASVFGKIAYIPDSLTQYRLHHANTSGWPPHLAAYVVDQIQHAAAYVRGNSIGANNRVQLLHRAQCSGLSVDMNKIKAAISFYKFVAAQNEKRLEIYTSRRSARRLKSLIRLLRAGAYTKIKPDSLGPDALLLDAFIGMPFAPRA